MNVRYEMKYFEMNLGYGMKYFENKLKQKSDDRRI